MARHVIKNTLKWGAIALIGGAVASAAMAAFAVYSTGGWGIAATILGFIPGTAPIVKGLGMKMGIAALQAGGILTGVAGVGGALMGGLFSFSSASEAADAEEDRLVAKYEQAEARRARMAALERRRDEQRYAMERQGMAMGGANLQIPHGKQPHSGAGHRHA